MMRNDEILDFCRQSMLLSHCKSVRDMSYDLLCALLRREAFMITDFRCLIFCKALRVGDFSYVMIKRPGTHEKDICIYRTSSRICKIHDLKRMLECTRRLVRQFSQKLVVGIAEFRKLGI